MSAKPYFHPKLREIQTKDSTIDAEPYISETLKPKPELFKNQQNSKMHNHKPELESVHHKIPNLKHCKPEPGPSNPNSKLSNLQTLILNLSHLKHPKSLVLRFLDRQRERDSLLTKYV